MASNVNVWIALWAGFASFISPCCLPLYPSYISYITGISVSRLKAESSAREVRLATLTHTLFFIAGFSAVFYSLGFGAGLLAEWFHDYANVLRTVAGILILFMGVILLGLLQPQMLMREWKLEFKNRPAGYLGSFLIGIGFAAGWSPCVGPILSAILALSTTEPGAWLQMITAYTLGFAVPFFILAFFIGTTKWIVKYSRLLMKIGGAFMIVFGLLLISNKMILIVIWLQSITPDWLIF